MSKPNTFSVSEEQVLQIPDYNIPNMLLTYIPVDIDISTSQYQYQYESVSVWTSNSCFLNFDSQNIIYKPKFHTLSNVSQIPSKLLQKILLFFNYAELD
jgi:hypothetical protein